MKLCPKKARLLPLGNASGPYLLVDKAELHDIDDPECSLFPSSLDPPEDEPEDESLPADAAHSPLQLPPLPFGLLDLDPTIVTDPGPPFRVRCYVAGCTNLLRPPRRGFRGDVCRQHGIRTHLSGSAATYTYSRAERNIIVAPELFKHKLRGNPHKWETHRFGYERGEDCFSWNYFRSMQEAGCLHEVAKLITGLEITDEPTLYLWGLRMSDDSLALWDLLQAARDRFETSRLPVKRPATEPDIGLHLAQRYLILIEAKLASANTFYVEGPRRNNQSLTKEELINLYQDPSLQILDVGKAQIAERVFYQLWRNMIFAEYMAQQDSPSTLAFHANLVRAGYEHESTQEFSQLITPAYQDRFLRITWEQLYVLAGLHWRKLSRLQQYMLTKTLGLAPAFDLDGF